MPLAEWTPRKASAGRHDAVPPRVTVGLVNGNGDRIRGTVQLSRACVRKFVTPEHVGFVLSFDYDERTLAIEFVEDPDRDNAICWPRRHPRRFPQRQTYTIRRVALAPPLIRLGLRSVGESVTMDVESRGRQIVAQLPT